MDSTSITKEQIEELMAAAIEARSTSYSPYSHFAVGAAVLCSDGNIVKGCNIENASYGLTNCAERTAIFKAISDGYQEFSAIAIVADTEGPCAPCGACRQVISEFGIDTIIMGNIKGEYTIITLDELLPYRFTSSSLEY